MRGDFYHDGLPPVLAALAATSPMQRLQQVGMNCGCEYTAFRRFSRLQSYSRYEHSLGVGLIVWHFTQDAAQAAAGLLHDVATPTFAHVVDFLRGDYLTQEATEDGTRAIIETSAEIQRALRSFGLCTEQVCDYHCYPIADNDAPRLSADRLEYTLGNLRNYALADEATLRGLYRTIAVTENEDGAPELAFSDPEAARQFAALALDCSEIYVSDEDRYAMQMLAELLAGAMRGGVLTEQDLMTEEPRLIDKLCADPAWARRWEAYRAMYEMERADRPLGEGWRRIDAKRRCIDPLVIGQGRVSALDPAFAERLHRFRTKPLDVWLHAK